MKEYCLSDKNKKSLTISHTQPRPPSILNRNSTEEKECGHEKKGFPYLKQEKPKKNRGKLKESKLNKLN